MSATVLIERATSYMHRTDLATLWPTFIANAEAYLFRELSEIREVETSVTGTAVDGYITLPADFGSMGRLTVTIGGQEINVTYNAQTDTHQSTNPITYSQENNKLRLFPTASSHAYKLYYLVSFTPLSVDVNVTNDNWLYQNAPDLYLYATCLEAAKWVRDGDQIAILSQNVATLMDSVRNLSKRRAKPVRGGLQVRFKNILT